MNDPILKTAASLLVVAAAGCTAAATDCDLALTCPDYANSGTIDPDGGGKPNGGPDCTVRPSDMNGPPDARCGVFAAPGAASGGDGSKDAPFASLSAAIDAAAASGKVVYACADVFEEVLRVPSGTSLFGGLDCEAGWVFTTERRTAIKPVASAGPGGSEIAARLSSGEGKTIISDVDITSPHAAASGASSIGLVIGDTAAEIVRCAITAGDGKSGAPGVFIADDPALQGIDGEQGYDICGATNENPGPPGALKVCGPMASHGGNGGDGGPPQGGDGGQGETGLPVAPATPGAGLGGAGQSTAGCTAGVQGGNGARGLPGEGASGTGKLSMDGYEGIAGQDGQRGIPGQGGGGGGGSRGKAQVSCPNQATLGRAGATGGSGGTGGCGGLGGTGGQAGGSSIALASLSKKPVLLTGVTIHVGKGGKGGDGAAGQNGGNGGFGKSGGQGASGAANGCHGGDGGNGGNGGPGGGGLGGHAIGVAYTLSAPKGAPVVSYGGAGPSPGLGGAPGAASIPATGMGASGISGALVSFMGP